jgi:hypothetical protein
MVSSGPDSSLLYPFLFEALYKSMLETRSRGGWRRLAKIRGENAISDRDWHAGIVYRFSLRGPPDCKRATPLSARIFEMGENRGRKQCRRFADCQQCQHHPPTVRHSCEGDRSIGQRSGHLASWSTLPSTTQTCVSSIETSRPAKYSTGQALTASASLARKSLEHRER